MTTNDAARVFDLLSINPKNNFTLILRTLGRLMLIDSAAAVELAVNMYPMLKVRRARFCMSHWRVRAVFSIEGALLQPLV